MLWNNLIIESLLRKIIDILYGNTWNKNYLYYFHIKINQLNQFVRLHITKLCIQFSPGILTFSHKMRLCCGVFICFEDSPLSCYLLGFINCSFIFELNCLKFVEIIQFYIGTPILLIKKFEIVFWIFITTTYHHFIIK